MKIAQLHDGTEIHFRDDTPEEEMDAAVNHHIAFSKAIKTERQKENEKQRQHDLAANELNHKTHVITAAANVEATKNLTKATEEGLNSLAGPLAAVADAMESKTPELIMAINKLSDTILEVGSAVVRAMMAEKVIQRDENNAPVSIRPKREG